MLKLGFIFLLLISAYPPDVWALVANSRARRSAQDEACRGRAFVCYAYAWMAMKGLSHDPPIDLEKECKPCAPKICATPPFFAPTPEFWPQIGCDPANYFCENFATEGVAAQPTCIKPLAFSVEMTGGVEKKHVLLAFNVCTREMLAKENCPVDLLSRVPYNPESVKMSSAFYVQCDAGFLVPRAVRRAHDTSVDPKPALTCVPSLQVATGLIPTDLSPLPKELHDIPDPAKITYCPAGSTDVEADCVPRPICGEGSVPAELKAISDAVPVECVEACAYKYQGSRDDYANCQLLDVVDRQDEKDIKVYVLGRQMSGPYAVLMSLEETLKYARKGPTTAAAAAGDTNTTEPLFRLRRDVDPANIDYKYPRCIDWKDLKDEQAALVKNDYFLDCATNPLVARYPDDISLRAIPRPCTAVDSEMELCIVPAVPPAQKAPDVEDNSKDWTMYLGAGGAVLIVIVAGGLFAFFCKRSGGRATIDAEAPLLTPSPDGEKDGSVDADAASPASTGAPTAEVVVAKLASGSASVPNTEQEARESPGKTVPHTPAKSGRPDAIERPAARDNSAPQHRRVLSMLGPSDDEKLDKWCQDIFRTGPVEIVRQYNAAKRGPPPRSRCTRFWSNLEKNRYKDVFCLDAHAVILSDGGYIHASHVPTTPDAQEDLICSQAPLEKTCVDHLRMIREQGVERVLVLCNFMEQNKEKCYEYWPQSEGEVKTHGIYTLRLVKKETMTWQCTTTADVMLYHLVVEVDKVVVHSFQLAHWLNWPDRSTPDPDPALLELMSRVSDTKKPILVHCSAGVGRTGVFALAMMIVKRLKAADSDAAITACARVIDLLIELREYRVNSVQTLRQYIYVIQTILSYCLQTGILKDSFRDQVNSFTSRCLSVPS